MTNTASEIKGPWTKYKLTEFAYLMAYTQGYNSAFHVYKEKCSYEPGSGLRKAFNRGRRDAKKF